MFVLAHLSDIHLAPLPSPRPTELLSKRGLGYINWLRKRHRIHQAGVLAAIVRDVQSQAADHVAVTGDMVNLSLDSEFAAGRAWLDRLGPPDAVTFVPGNHDAYVRGAPENAIRAWGDYMRGDLGESFPFVRRRGPVAIVGLSTSVPTWPLAATGRLNVDQLDALGGILNALAKDGLFRVVLIHHPPTGGSYFRRLSNAEALRELLRKHGAELVLHGHHHEASVKWLAGAKNLIPCVGVPSASVAAGHHDDPAGYNLYEIDGKPGAWRCTAISRGLTAEDAARIEEVNRIELADY